MERAGEVLKKYFGHGIFSQAGMYSNFFNSWEFFVGKKFYGHSKIIEIYKNNLYVAIDHPGWLQLFLLREKELLNKIRKYHPQLKIKSIKFKVEYKAFKEETPKPESDVNEDDFAQIEEDLPKISNNELKLIFNKLYKSVISRHRRVDKSK